MKFEPIAYHNFPYIVADYLFPCFIMIRSSGCEPQNRGLGPATVILTDELEKQLSFYVKYAHPASYGCPGELNIYQ